MDREEFRRRIEVYLEQETPDLADDNRRIAEVIARRIWPLVGRWQSEMKTSAQTMAWIGQRLQEDWPEAAGRLSVEQSGSDVGWWPNLRRPRIYGDFNNMDQEGRVRLNTAGTKADVERIGLTLQACMLVTVYDGELETRATVRWSREEAILVAELERVVEPLPEE